MREIDELRPVGLGTQAAFVQGVVGFEILEDDAVMPGERRHHALRELLCRLGRGRRRQAPLNHER